MTWVLLGMVLVFLMVFLWYLWKCRAYRYKPTEYRYALVTSQLVNEVEEETKGTLVSRSFARLQDDLDGAF